MLTLLVYARAHGQKDSTYRTVIEEFRTILGTDPRSPVQQEALRPKWPPKSLRLEILNLNRLNSIFVSALKAVGFSIFARILFLFRLSAGSFNPDQYKREVETNADFRKFDDMLRMVLDCSETQASRLEALLEDHYQKGHLYYGIHKSTEALMTCLVFSLASHQHVHFVDGSNGGYAMAATQLKTQMK